MFKNVKKRNSNNMYRQPKVLGLKTTLHQICCPFTQLLRSYIGPIIAFKLYGDLETGVRASGALRVTESGIIR